MTILKNKANKGKSGAGTSLIGTFINTNIDEYMRLHSIHKDCSKSDIIRNLVTDWYNRHEREMPAVDIERCIARKAVSTWKKDRIPIGQPFSGFISELSTELRGKKLSGSCIQRILTTVTNEAGQ